MTRARRARVRARFNFRFPGKMYPNKKSYSYQIRVFPEIWEISSAPESASSASRGGRNVFVMVPKHRQSGPKHVLGRLGKIKKSDFSPFFWRIFDRFSRGSGSKIRHISEDFGDFALFRASRQNYLPPGLGPSPSVLI